MNSSDSDGTLHVSIPLETPLRPLLGSKVVIPCYFQDSVNEPGAPTSATPSHRIKWTYVTKEKATTILVASEGKVQVETEYLDRVTMVNYPLVATDVSMEITELSSKDSGTYRCEVTLGIEDHFDSVDIQVQGTSQTLQLFRVRVLSLIAVVEVMLCDSTSKCQTKVIRTIMLRINILYFYTQTRLFENVLKNSQHVEIFSNSVTSPN